MKLKNKIIPSVLCAAFSLPFTSAIADVLHPDDVIVDGSLCAGLDCVNGENFGFDTLRLKENNLRIKFMDTSGSSSFPTNDWQITINDSANGGVNKFSIEDIDGGTTPFTILASAPNDSLFISSSGYIGLGTTAPVVQIHVKDGNSPTLRLEQDTSAGFSEQIWDLGGNEANFFIRDATNGSKLPFRIVPNAPDASIYVAADGDVGFETNTPDGLFDVAHSADANDHAFLIGTDSAVGVNIDNGQIPIGLFDVQTTGGVSRFTVEADGDVGVGTNTPSGRFEVKSLDGVNSYFNIDDSGDVGIGTNAPNKTLHLERSDGLTGMLIKEASIVKDNTRVLLQLENNGSAKINLVDSSIDSTASWVIATTSSDLVFNEKTSNNAPELTMGENGDLFVRGDVTANNVLLTSDRNMKENFQLIDTVNVLQKIAKLEVLRWNYKLDDDSNQHIGPMAQDFSSLFGLGDSDQHISSIDLTGVTLAAIKALNSIVEVQKEQIDKLEEKIESLRKENNSH
jgi:hypothetical protein